MRREKRGRSDQNKAVHPTTLAERKQGNWIQIMPGKGWWLILRQPDRAFLNARWSE
jgi:hypothetical protein